MAAPEAARPRELLERSWQGKRVVIVGLARQGKALARFLSREGAQVIVTDRKLAGELADAIDELADLPMEFELGGHPLSIMDHAQALFLSGGVPNDNPLAVQAKRLGLPILNDAQLFVERTPALTVGISGSAGKSTTTALVGHIGRLAFSQASGRVWVGGNLGRPLLLDLDAMKPADVAVLELSSFQLELMTAGVDLAVLLNLTPDHLDRHGSMEAYTAAKLRLLTCQADSALAVLNKDDDLVWKRRHQVRGSLAAFSVDRVVERGAYIQDGMINLRSPEGDLEIAPLHSVQLPGAHNLSNALAAVAVSGELGWPAEAIQSGLETFLGLPHRLETVAKSNGVRWINDSIATTPSRAAAGLGATPGQLILLAGGRDKGLDWTPLVRAARERVRAVLLFGEAAGMIRERLAEAGFSSAPVELVGDLRGAVERARELAEDGDAVLLSPGGTSFDAFRDFEARGDAFRELVNVDD